MISDIFLIIISIIILSCAVVCAVAGTVGFIVLVIDSIRFLRKK